MSTFGNSEEAIYRCATVFEGAGAWEELLQAAKSWKSQFPTSSRNADLAAARALLENGRFAQAADVLAPYAAAMSSSPDKEPIMIRLYLTALAAGGRVDAAERFAGELMKNPVGRPILAAAIGKQVPASTARAWLEGAGVLESQGDGQGMLAVATGWSMLAARTNDASDKARARELLTQLSQRPGVKPEVVTGAAMALEAIKDSDLAAKFYQQALASGSNNPVAQNNLAMLLAAKGGRQDLDQAIHLASDAVKALPAQPALRDTLASVLARDKQLAPAVESMKEAVRLEPGNVKWRTRLAGYLADSGELEEARRQVDVVDSLGASPWGGTPDVKDELSRLREKLRN
jgi:Flp pilus assembly protein TadD